MITFFYAFYAYGTVFAICELSERLGNLFNEIKNTMGQLEWYLFPSQIHKMLPTILLMIQEPFEVGCFGSIACNRDTFKKVNLTKYTINL